MCVSLPATLERAAIRSEVGFTVVTAVAATPMHVPMEMALSTIGSSIFSTGTETIFCATSTQDGQATGPSASVRGDVAELAESGYCSEITGHVGGGLASSASGLAQRLCILVCPLVAQKWNANA